MRSLSLLLLASLLVLGQPARANVVIAGTRVVYPADKQEVTLQLSNVGEQPALVQAWIDGDENARSPNGSEAPFVIMPPIARIGPGKSQTLRIAYTGEQVPDERESVYWLNVLDVPPRPANIGTKNYMQMSIRSQIKLFFRPANLPGSADTAAGQLEWSLVAHAGKAALKVVNPSRYHVSLSAVELEAGAKPVPAGGGMVGPGQELELELPPDAPPLSPGQNVTVHYVWINDHGAAVPGSKSL
ncbi:TPA: molecular chaperone [Pseudomonas aeruginosa]|nr:molecular chaperone [Pseudomonas aeruginosa]